jgi:hypothetical protein
MQARFPSIEHWMIGRGLISDPFTQYDQRQQRYQKNKMELFSEFHDTYTQATESLSGSTHILLKCTIYGNTFQSFFDPHKVAKT